MKITIDLIHGLPKQELIERIHFHNRQGEISDRALGFYLLELEKTKQFLAKGPGTTSRDSGGRTS